MARRILPVVLVLASVAATARGHGELGFFVLVAAVPPAALAALLVLGEWLDTASHDPVRPVLGLELLLGAAGLALLVSAAALRGDAGAVAPASSTALGACLAFLVAQAVVWLVVPVPRAVEAR